MNTSGLRFLGSITPKAESESETVDSDVEMKTLVAAIIGSIMELVERDLDTT